LRPEDIQEIIELQIRGPEPLGEDPETGLPVYCLIGRYGPYVQLGEATEEQPKPKRAGIPKGKSPRDVTLEDALLYLSLPRTLGVHPESGKDIVANVGRFGPFVVHDGDFRSLKKDDDVYTIELPRAMEILSEEKKGRGRGSTLIRELGEHDKKKVSLYDGKYGPYIKYGSKNISLPDAKKEDEALKALSLKEAVEIIKSK
jgi:DNA topoisomerase-1